MNRKSYLIFDFGASHGRCIVGNYAEGHFNMDIIHDFKNNPVKYADTLYWDLLSLTHEMLIGCKKAFDKYPNIESIGIDTWGCDFAFIDKYGKLLSNPVNYRDELRYKYKKQLDYSFGEYNIFRYAGANTNNIMALYHFYGLLQERPEELERAAHFLMMPDLFNYFLTGEVVNEYTNCTMTLLVDQVNKAWQNNIIEPLGIPKSIFSEMVNPGHVLGLIQDKVCEQYGFPKIPVINVASHDTASAIAGLPIDDEKKNWAFISLGTWAIFGIETDKIYSSESVFKTGFGTQGGCENKNNFVNLVSGLWVIQQCHEAWEKESNDGVSWDTIVSEAEKAKPVNSIIPLDDEQFVLPSANMPELIADYCRITEQRIPSDLGETARCVYESLVLKLRDCYENIVKITGKNIEVLHVVGGGSKNKLLCQWIADATGVLIKAGPSETTSVGNLLLQMKGTGEIASLSEGRKIAAASISVKEYFPGDKSRWDELFKRYQLFMK